ncbi:MAG: hypothetical protein LBU27_03025 [Candidatus Peribacteria bacterium]|nr:hypothetical protein [Candidatus Peribacteria bacterium]
MHYSFPLQKVNDDLKSRTDEFINANYHGGILSHSLYGVRYINFSGAGDCLTTETRGIVLEILKKNLSLAPGTDDNEYFDLFRETGDGKPRTCKAKVSQAITAEHDVTALKFGYSFQLACPSEKVYGLETYTEQIPMGFFSGSPLPQALPFAIG